LTRVAHTAGGAYVTTLLVVMYAPLGIGRRSGQTFRSLVCVRRKGAYIQAKSAWTYAPPAKKIVRLNAPPCHFEWHDSLAGF